MNPVAASSSSFTAPQIGALLLVLLVTAAGYLLARWAWPISSCRRCGGAGKTPLTVGRIVAQGPTLPGLR